MAQYLDKTGLTTLWAKIKEQDCKPLYNLGAYDTISGNVITRQTGYLKLDGVNVKVVNVEYSHYISFNFVSPNKEAFTLVASDFGVSTTTNWDTNDGFYFNPVGDYRLTLKATGQPVKTINEWNTYFSQNPIYIQYKLATSYTEEIIEGQPLITLDQQGSQWLRDEWEKGLNLLNTFDRSNIPTDSSLYNATLNNDGSYTSTATSDQRAWTYSNSDFKLHLTKGKYYLSVTGTISTGYVEIYNTNDKLLVATSSENNYKGSFTLTNDTNVGIMAKLYNSSNVKIMLNEGDHPYPYQAYNGEIVHDKDIADLYKQEYNLGYYDTMVANSDGTYTITRQTGYVDLGTFDWALDGTNRFFNRCGLDFEMPSTSDTKPNIISSKYSAITEYEYVQRSKIGISIAYSSGIKTILIYDTNYNDVNTFKSAVQGVILQYKLATPLTTEKVEKNHYSLYNQDFILEHNKSEAERRTNLFSGGVSLMDKGLVIGKQYIITTKNKTIYNFKIATFSNAVTGSVEVLNEKNNTSTFIFTWNTNKNWNLYVFDTNWVLQNNDDIEIMLNEGSIALPYQPYNSNAHITNYEADFLKTESDRSANLFDDNGTNSIQYIGRFYTNDTAANYVLSPHDNYNCFRIRVEQNKTYYIKEINGLILRFEDINNNVVGGKSLFNIGYGAFTTPNGCKYVVFSKQINLATNVTMLNEGTEPLPYQPYEGKVVHEKELGDKLSGYVTTNTAQTITGYKKISSIGIDTINGATLGNAIVRQNTSTGEVILGSTVRPLRLWGNQTRPSYSKNDGVSYSDLALLSDVPSIYGVSQLYRHDIEFDILNGDGVKCTFWSTSNNKITDFSQIPYLAFSNIQVKNISNEKILNVVQWNSDGFRFYESDGTSTLIGDGYDGVTAYYINGEPQL